MYFFERKLWDEDGPWGRMAISSAFHGGAPTAGGVALQHPRARDVDLGGLRRKSLANQVSAGPSLAAHIPRLLSLQSVLGQEDWSTPLNGCFGSSRSRQESSESAFRHLFLSPADFKSNLPLPLLNFFFFFFGSANVKLKQLWVMYGGHKAWCWKTCILQAV